MAETAETTGVESQQSEGPRPPNASDLASDQAVSGPAPDAAAKAKSPATAPRPPVGRVLQQTGDYIEPITRFDHSDLQETAPEEHSRLVAVMSCSQRVSFSTNVRRYAGPMHQSAVKVQQHDDVTAMTHRLLQAAEAQLASRVSAWAAEDAGEYRRLLPGQPFLSGFTDRYGFNYDCGPCHGNGEVTCSTCGGSCRTTCHFCHGLGRTHCHACGGNGSTRCLSCNGQGSGYRYEYVTEWDYSKNMNVSVQKQVYRSCFCNAGYNSCNFCLSSGKVQCHTCSGSGSNRCSTCGATGKTPCNDCAATGTQHTLGYIESTVSTSESLELHHDEPAVVALMKPRLTIAGLAQQTRLTAVRHTPNGARIDSRYQTDLAVTKGNITAAGMAFSIFGFGAQNDIFDYQNIAGKLLQTDVERLDAAISQTSAWRIRGGDDVLQATSAFVESELNLLIAENVAGTKASDTASAAATVESQFKGLVDQAYVTHATEVFKRALGRLYQPHMVEPGLYCTGIAVLVSAAVYGFRWPDRAWALPLGLAAGAVGWACIEFSNRRRIARLFPGATGPRILKQVDASGLPARLRWVALSVALAGSLAAMWGINALPHERSRRAEEISALDLKAALQNWRSSPQADLRLRSYPALAPLRKLAAQGDPEAATVLGWQLVLGAGGVAKDVPEATRLFNAAAAQTPRSGLIQTGQVVALLNSDATPQSLRDGLASLRQAEAGGLVEARYWRARLQLAEQSPVRDARAGLQAMNEAADMGHASAALEMGKRFAAGNGVRTDNRRATSYLQRAASAGLPEAKAELAR